MAEFFRGLAQSLGDSPAPHHRYARGENPPPHAFAGSAHQPVAHTGAGVGGIGHGADNVLRGGRNPHAFSSPSRPPHAASAASSPPPARASPAPAASPSAQAQSSGFSDMSLSALRSELDRHAHTLSVCESRLEHCFDSGDEEGAGAAAKQIAAEKRTLRELSALIHARERQESMEARVRAGVERRFAGEKATVLEHRRKVALIKERLRVAFSISAVSVDGDVAMGASDAVSSPSPSSSPSLSPDLSLSQPLSDLLPRLKLEVARHQNALEHLCLHVDGIELSELATKAEADHAAGVAQAHAGEGAPAPPGGAGFSAEGGGSGSINGSAPSNSNSGTSSGVTAWSSDLTTYFKTSRKDVVHTLQAVLADADAMLQHLKHAEAFLAFLQQDGERR